MHSRQILLCCLCSLLDWKKPSEMLILEILQTQLCFDSRTKIKPEECSFDHFFMETPKYTCIHCMQFRIKKSAQRRPTLVTSVDIFCFKSFSNLDNPTRQLLRISLFLISIVEHSMNEKICTTSLPQPTDRLKEEKWEESRSSAACRSEPPIAEKKYQKKKNLLPAETNTVKQTNWNLLL